MSTALDVYLYGVHAATLTRSGAQRYPTLQYTEEYIAEPDAVPISVLFPVTQARHDPRAVDAFLENLLPDRDDVRQKWAAEAKLPNSTAFELLRVYGADVQGALEFYPSGAKPARESNMKPLSAEQIGDRIRQIRDDSTEWLDLDNPDNAFSLGGHQGKFALALRDGEWYEPSGDFPSTHIFKPGVDRKPGSDVTEHIMMALARQLGLPVATTSVEIFDGEHVLVVERYDRLEDDEGYIHRVHQEDLAQATGTRSHQKYEKDGGPSYLDLFSVFDRHLTFNDARNAKAELAMCMIVSFVIGHNDGHAKNYSLLHLPGRSVLAPFYDLNNIFAFLPPQVVRAKDHRAFDQIRMSFTMHGAQEVGEHTAEHFKRMFEDAGMYGELAENYMRRIAATCMPDLNQIIDELPGAVRELEAVKNLPFVMHTQLQRVSALFNL